MTDLILDNIYLILLLPLWIFLIIMCGRFFSVYVNKKIIHSLTLLSSFLGGLLCSVSLLKTEGIIEQSFQFIKINDFVLSFGLHIDKTSLIIALVLFIVSFCVQLFSISYMKNEEKEYRFFALLNLFNFSMAGLLFSQNMFQMYAFWELVGVASYLLIGFDYKKEKKSKAAKRVFIINRIGDTALIGAIILTSYFMYNYAGNLSFTTLGFEDMNAISTLLYAYTSTPQFYLICIMFIFGAMVKSAQFPFHIWLQDAMEAKLPVSALLHSATMVIAGVYLLIRLVPMFMLEKTLLIIICTIGLVSAILCSIYACVETHPKKVLAYSTSANLGLMFLALGVLNIKAALVFLIAHAFIKSMLFICLPKEGENINYITLATFVIGALSLAGLIFSGVCAKEFLYTTVEGNKIFAILFCINSFLTAFYITRLPIVMIKDREIEKSFDYSKYIPAGALLILNIVFYFIIRRHLTYQIAEPFWLALTAWIVVYILYTRNLLTRFPAVPKLIEDFSYKIIPFVYEKFAGVCSFVDTKILGNYKPLIFTASMGVKFSGLIEKYVMDGSVNFITSCAKMFSYADKKLQSKNVQTYNAYAFIIITVILSLVITGYTFMLSQFK